MPEKKFGQNKKKNKKNRQFVHTDPMTISGLKINIKNLLVKIINIRD